MADDYPVWDPKRKKPLEPFKFEGEENRVPPNPKLEADSERAKKEAFERMEGGPRIEPTPYSQAEKDKPILPINYKSTDNAVKALSVNAPVPQPPVSQSVKGIVTQSVENSLNQRFVTEMQGHLPSGSSVSWVNGTDNKVVQITHPSVPQPIVTTVDVYNTEFGLVPDVGGRTSLANVPGNTPGTIYKNDFLMMKDKGKTSSQLTSGIEMFAIAVNSSFARAQSHNTDPNKELSVINASLRESQIDATSSKVSGRLPQTAINRIHNQINFRAVSNDDPFFKMNQDAITEAYASDIYRNQTPGSVKDKLQRAGYLIGAGSNNGLVLESVGHMEIVNGRPQVVGHQAGMLQKQKMSQELGGQMQLQALTPTMAGGRITGYQEVAPRHITSESDKAGYRYLNIKQPGERTPVEVEMLVMAATVNSGVSYKFKNNQRNETWGRTDASIRQDLKGFNADDLMKSQIDFTAKKGEYGKGIYGIASVTRGDVVTDVSREKSTEEFYPNKGQNYIYIPTHQFGGDFVTPGAPGSTDTIDYQRELQERNPNAIVVRMAGITTPQLGVGGTQVMDYRNRGNAGNRKSSDLNVGNSETVNIGGQDVQVGAIEPNIKSPRALESFFGAMTNKQQRNVLGMWSDHNQGSEESRSVLANFDQQIASGDEATAIDLESLASSGGFKGGSIGLMQSVFGIAEANKNDPEYQKRLGAAAGVQYIDASPEKPKDYEIGFWSNSAYKTLRNDTVSALMTSKSIGPKQAIREFKKMYSRGENSKGERNILTQHVDFPHFAGWAGTSRVGDSPSTGTLNAQLYGAIKRQYPEMADELGLRPDMPFTPQQQASAGMLSFLGTENDKRAGRKYKAKKLSKEQIRSIAAIGGGDESMGYSDYATKVAEITGGSMNEPFEVGGQLFPSGLAVSGKQSEANMEGNEFGPGRKFFNALSSTVNESLLSNEQREFEDSKRRKNEDGSLVMSRAQYASEILYKDVSSQGETLMKSLGTAEDSRYSWTGIMPSTFGGLKQRFTSAKQANLEDRNIARQYGIKTSDVRKLRKQQEMRTLVQRQGEKPEMYTESDLNAELSSIQSQYNLSPERIEELKKEVARHPSKTFESTGSGLFGLLDFDGDTKSSFKTLFKNLKDGKLSSLGGDLMRFGSAAVGDAYRTLNKDLPSKEVQLKLSASQKEVPNWHEDILGKLLKKVDTVTDPFLGGIQGNKGKSASDAWRMNQVLSRTEEAFAGRNPGTAWGQGDYGNAIDEIVKSPLGTAYASSAVRVDKDGELFFGYNNGQNYQGSEAKKMRKIYANDPGAVRNFLVGNGDTEQIKGEDGKFVSKRVGGLVQDATAPVDGMYYQTAEKMTMMFGRDTEDRAQLKSLLEGSSQSEWEGIIEKRVTDSYSKNGELLEGEARKKVDAQWMGTSGISSLLSAAIVKNANNDVVNTKDEKIRVAGGTQKFMSKLVERGGGEGQLRQLNEVAANVLADRQFRGQAEGNEISMSALQLLPADRREAIALQGGTTSTSDARAEISDPLTARMLSAMPQLNAVGSQSVENLTPQVTPTPNTPTPQIAPTSSASTPLQVGAPPVWSNGGAWSGEDQKEYLSLDRERNSKSRLEISPENSARFAELDLKKRHFSRVEEGGPTSDVSGNFDGVAGSPPILPSDTPGEDGTAPYGKDKGQKLSYSQAAKLLTNFASFDKNKGKRIISRMSSYISDVSKASGRDDVDAGNAFDILHSDDVTENQRSFIQKRFGTIAARGAELRQRAMHAIWATKSYPGLRNMSEHEGQIQQLDSYLQSPNQAAMDAGKGFMQLNASLTPADDKQNEYALQGAMRLAGNEQVGVLAGALRDAGTDPQKMSQVVQQHGPLMREVGKTVPMLKGANMSVATPEMLQVAEQYKYATGPGGMVAKDFKGSSGASLPYTEEALGKLASVMERVKKNTESLTEAQVNGDKATEKRLITEKKKLDFEQEVTIAQTQAQAHRTKASSILDQIIGGDVSEETTKAYRSNLDAAQKYEKQASDIFQEDQAQQPKNRLGSAARKIFGGFGLMYLGSIAGMAKTGLEDNNKEALEYQTMLSQTAVGLSGRSQQYNQSIAIQNQKSILGPSVSSLKAIELAGMRTPLLGEAGNSALSGAAAWGASTWAMGELGIGAAAAGPLALGIGAGVMAANVGAQAWQRSQDPKSLAYRNSRFFTPEHFNEGDNSGLNWSKISGYDVLATDYLQFADPTKFAQVNKESAEYTTARERMQAGGKYNDVFSGIGGSDYEKYQMATTLNMEFATDAGKSYSQESLAKATYYAQKGNLSLSQEDTFKFAEKLDSGIAIDQIATSMLTGAGVGSRYSRVKREDGSTQLTDMMKDVMENVSSPEDAESIIRGTQYASQLGGFQELQGQSFAKQSVYYKNLDNVMSQENSGQAFSSARQAYQNQLRAGMKATAPDPTKFDPMMDVYTAQQSISESTAQNYLATQNMQMGQALYNNAAFYGDNTTGKSAYNMMANAKPGTQMFMNRAMNGDPMALTAAGLGGVNYGNLQLPTIDGGKFDASAFGRMGNTDIGLNGKMTGMQWGSTSLQSSTAFGGTVSAQQNAQNIWGSNNKNFSQAVIGAATNGVKLDQKITMPDGSVIDSIAGTEGIRLQQRNAGFEFTLGNLARQEKSASLDEAYTQKSWKTQDQGRELSNAYQEWQFGFQQKQLDMNRANNNENMGLQKQQTMMQRTYAKEDWAYGDQTRGLQWGWKQEDFAEESRFMTGRSRKKAERQNERDTTMHNLEEGQIEKSKERQQETWKLEDQRFAVQRKQFEQSMKMQQESLDKNKEYFEARKDLEQSEVKFQREHYKQQLALQKEATAAQKKYTLEQIASQKAMDQLELEMRLTNAASNTLVDGWQTLIQKSMVADEQLKKFAETIEMVGNNANGSTSPSDTMPSDGPLCFTGDMKISMANGSQVRFSDVEVGDKLLSWHEGKVIETEIECIFAHPEKIAKDILVVNGFLRVTPNHPLFINNEWSDASTLKIGDSLLGIDGSAIEVTSIQYEQTEEAVYNLHISHEAHNYFVEGILAHNKRALGGSIFAGERDIVGENGPEEFIPDVNGKIIPNHRLGSNYSNYAEEYTSNLSLVPARSTSQASSPQINIYIGGEEIKDYIINTVQRSLK